ncbi:12871_t:CDS:2, partial [Entrophospora sp. SA101]
MTMVMESQHLEYGFLLMEIYMMTMISNIIIPTEPSQLPCMISILEAMFNNRVIEVAEVISNNVPVKYQSTYMRSPCGPSKFFEQLCQI